MTNIVELPRYDSLANDISIKLILAGSLLLLAAMGPPIVALWKTGFSVVFLVCLGWAAIAGWLASACFRIARRIPRGFTEIWLDGENLVLARGARRTEIPTDDIETFTLSKLVSPVIGFEIVITRDRRVTHVATAPNRSRLEPIFKIMVTWLGEDKILTDEMLKKRFS